MATVAKVLSDNGWAIGNSISDDNQSNKQISKMKSANDNDKEVFYLSGKIFLV